MNKNNKLQIRNSTAEFLIFTNQSGGESIEVRVQDGTIWLSQKNMGLLFDTSNDNIGLHLKNIFADGELSEVSTAEDFSVVQQRGNLCIFCTSSNVLAKQHAENEFEKYRPIQDRLFESDFDKVIKSIEKQ